MQRIKTGILSAALAFGLVLPTVFAPSVLAADCAANPNLPACKVLDGSNGVGGSTQEANCGPDKKQVCTLEMYVTSIVNILLFIIGAIAVVMIIIGGIRYTTSNGDASQTKSAKDTILYSIVGLVIAIMAYAIVNFVLSKLG